MMPARPNTIRLVLGATLAIALVAATRVSPRPLDQDTRPPVWLKGNTHTHTTESDGDSTPDVVTRVVSRARLSVPGAERPQRPDIGRRAERAPRQGRAVSADQGRRGHRQLRRQAGAHQRPRCRRDKVDPQKGASLLDVLQRNVDAIRPARGVPHINHPNFGWAFSTDELQQVRNTRLLEIFNGHPQVNNLGGGGVAGLEEVWDAVLSSGTLMYGIAVDDAHTFKQPGNPAVAGPGRGWVMVRAARLEARALLEALEAGSSTPRPASSSRTTSSTSRSMIVTVKKDAWSKYRIQFIGKGGRVVAGITRQPGRIRLPWRRGLRARQGHRKQRPRGVVSAGAGEDATASSQPRAARPSPPACQCLMLSSG